MGEKKMQPLWTRRLLFYVVTFSVFLLFFSCFALLKSSSSNSLIPDSVLMFMHPNKTLAPHSNTHKSFLPHKSLNRLTTLATDPQAVRRKSKPNDGKGKEASCDINEASLKVYMYDLPPEFHFGLLDWKGKKNQIWPAVDKIDQVPSYPGGLNLQHSVEYWLTLDLLSSNVAGAVRPCTAIRAKDSSQADVFFVPYFSSVSYNRHSKLHGKEKVSRDTYLQNKLVKFLLSRDEWKRRGGRDHVILAHHPNSMLEARSKLRSAIFLLADFGRYPVEVANLKKDIVAPYVHVVNSIGKDQSAPFEERPTLVYFQGAIFRKDGGMIRQELYQLLKDEKDVHFTFGTARGGGIRSAAQGMASSKFCFNIAGDTPSSNRLFDAIVSHCVPVIISDDIELPFEDILDYSEFCVFVRGSDAMKKGYLLKLLRGISRDEWTKMWKRLQQIAHHFEYQYPSRDQDAVQMIWQEVAHKLSPLRLKLNKENRYHHQ